MVGKAVTKNRPLREGDVVTSIFATFTLTSAAVVANLSQVGAKFLHAGHHGAKLEIETKNTLIQYATKKT